MLEIALGEITDPIHLIRRQTLSQSLIELLLEFRHAGEGNVIHGGILSPWCVHCIEPAVGLADPLQQHSQNGAGCSHPLGNSLFNYDLEMRWRFRN